MKTIFLQSAIVLLLLLPISCADIFFNEDPKNTPENNFDLLWNEYNLLYSHFILKQIDWDSLYEVYRPQVSSSTSPTQLFEIMAAMLEPLNDGHVSLKAPFKSVFSNDAQKLARPLNFNWNNIIQTYLIVPRTAGGDRFIYGKVHPDVGYVLITTFEDEDFAKIDDWVKGIDEVINTLGNIKGLIVDIRNNGGGDAFNATSIAGRFADEKRLFAYGYSRNGIHHDDFSQPFAWYVKPEGPRQFTKPIILLTNRNTASASERFALSMKVFPYVRFVGDSTEGAFPHALPRELPNGWSYRVTTGVVVDQDWRSYEGHGIPPDIRVIITQSDDQQKKDPIIEKAIDLLK